jgi:hypothetical protein
MITFVRKARRVTEIGYARSFVYADDRGAGFSFPCDKNGQSLRDAKLNAAAQANYAACLKGSVNGHKVIDRGIVSRENRYNEPSVIVCVSCRKHVTLNSNTNRCSCGRYYNLSGQPLSDPSNWGEETGETAADILGPRRR